jgi:sec-independent protein translocase protein TatA
MPMPGPLELIVILVIALLILGPGKLPDVGSALGKSIREFRKAATDVQDATRLEAPTTPAAPPPAASQTVPPAQPAQSTPTATSEPSTEPKP